MEVLMKRREELNTAATKFGRVICMRLFNLSLTTEVHFCSANNNKPDVASRTLIRKLLHLSVGNQTNSPYAVPKKDFRALTLAPDALWDF